jgi:cobalt-zinc-cadmium efflux system outer membrane protein
VKQARSFGYLALAVGLIAAAACVRYEAKPIEPGRVLEDFEARRLDAPELGTFLVANKEVESWPPPAWDLKSLTLAAFYYHPDMDIARAQWGVARGG